jgi:solute carrier family 25 phosphate transporter 3
MPILFPTGDALKNAFLSSNSLTVNRSQVTEPPRTKYQARSELYSVWSVADDAKKKANQLSDAAVKEFEKTSGAAQAKVGKIELYSPKYYATCTLGGLMACVMRSRHRITKIYTKTC